MKIKFTTKYSEKIENRLLHYSIEDLSFDTEPNVSRIDLSLILNKLNLTVVDNKIVQIWGFCGNARTVKTTKDVPSYFKGTLMIEHSLQYGISYGIYNNEVPVYFNDKSGWVCLGNIDSTGEAVEFITNCVAVVNDEKLDALWLKPKWE